MTDSATLTIPAPELRGAGYDLGACTDLEVVLDGPAGTGKTYAALYKVHIMLLTNPGAKVLVARKTNTALAGSALATYREMVDPRVGVTYFGGNKVKPSAFEYSNGSVMIVSGLDKPDKIKSWEFDLAYINEATEVTEEDWEFVLSRLRHGKTDYPQLIADVNPGPPHHWLNQRMNSGQTRRLLSRHEDNPRFYDARAGMWTPDGARYLTEVLGSLTGVRRERLLEGRWASAEGQVYSEWDAAKHVIPRERVMVRDDKGRQIMPPTWPRYLVIDFGYTNPFTAQWYAQDPDGRLYLYREIYMTHRTVDVHAAEILRLSQGEPLPRAVICDPEDADGRAVITRVTRWGTIAAHKDVRNGIQAMKARLQIAGDGKPRFYVLQGALVERDPALVAAKKPTCLVEEMDGLVWDTRNNRKAGEEPMPGDDHGADAARYACAHFDLGQSGVAYVKSFY